VQYSENNSNSTLSRRDALRLLAATSGAAALSTLPSQWQTPLVEVGTLPAFAQASQQTVTPVTGPADYPFQNSSPTYSGDLSGLQIAPQNGWLVIAEQGQNIGTSSSYDYPWIITRPWHRFHRRWNVFLSPWPIIRKIKIKFEFQHGAGHGSSHNIRDNMDFWFYGMSGAFPDIYYVSKLKIRAHKIEIEFALPAIGSGFFPFFCSGYFPVPIALTGGFLFDPRLYLGAGIMGDDIDLEDYDTSSSNSQGVQPFDDVGIH